MIQLTDTFRLPTPLPLEGGELLAEAQIAYCAWGELAGDNACLLVHDLGDSHDGLGQNLSLGYSPYGWARELLGEHLALDVASEYVLSPCLLGSPFGSSSPRSVSLSDGRPLGLSFPAITVEDQARAVAGLVRGLRIRRLKVAVGIGLGGMVVLNLASLFPDLVGGIVVVGAAARLPETLRKRLGMSAQLIQSDSEFAGGSYPPGRGPLRTLRRLRQEWLRSHYDLALLAERQGSQAAADRFVEQAAEDFAAQFDPSCYASLTTTYAGCDLGHLLERVRSPALLVAGERDPIATPIQVRDTYHVLSAAGTRAHVVELAGPGGHADLLAEGARLHGHIRSFLATL